MKGYIKFPSLYQICLTFVIDCLKSSVNTYTAPFDIRNFVFFHSMRLISTRFSQVQVACVYSVNSWVFLIGKGFYLCEVRTCSQKHTFIIYSLMTIVSTSLPSRQTASKRPLPSDFQMTSPYNFLSPLSVQVVHFIFCYFITISQIIIF